jgi:hypothetical protein
LVSHIKGRIYAEVIGEQGAEKGIWASKAGIEWEMQGIV